MKNEYQGELGRFDYKSEPTFRRIEERASGLVLDSSHMRSVACIFKEKALNALKERNQEVLGKIYKDARNGGK